MGEFPHFFDFGTYFILLEVAMDFYKGMCAYLEGTLVDIYFILFLEIYIYFIISFWGGVVPHMIWDLSNLFPMAGWWIFM